MARSPIIPVLEGFKTLTVDEQKIFLDLVDPQPEPEPATQTRKKRGPSKKAQSLSAAIAKTPKVDAENEPEVEGPMCGACGNAEGYQDHFPPSPHFHEFVVPKVKKAVK